MIYAYVMRGEERVGVMSALGAHRVVEEICVGESYAVGKLCGVGPSKAGGFAHVEELARSAVRA